MSMERLVGDVRYAVRRLLRKPLFTMVAVVSLAIGIGANTAIFTLVNAVMLRELPLEAPEELVDVYRSGAGFSHSTFSYPDYVDLEREANDVFAGVGGTRLTFIQVDADETVEMVPGELVTGTYFPVLGVDAHVGRTLMPEDDVSPGGHPVAMLGHGYWMSRYGGDAGIVGQEIQLNGRPYTVIGVVPADYTGNIRGLEPAIYAPMMMVEHLNPTDYNELESRGSQSVFVKARMLPGVTFAQVAAAGERLGASFRERYPGQWPPDNEIVMVRTSEVIMNPMIDGTLVPAAMLMMVVVGLVLLIACANLASFLLAQAASRRKEIAVRLAMGARRRRLIQQLLTESLLLSVVGGAAGVALSSVLLGALVGADLPLPFPISLDLAPDATVLAFSLALALTAGVLFGLAPALQATNPDLAPTLKDESTGGGKPRRVTLRGSLVVAQVAVSMALLVGAGLFLMSLRARMGVDPGFGYEPAAVVNIGISAQEYSEDEGRVFIREYLDEVRRLPGVTAVGMTHNLHMSVFNTSMMGIQVEGVEPPPGQDYHLIDWGRVDAGFLETVGVRIVEGTGFDGSEEMDGPRVAIVNRALAERFWPGESAVGRTFRRGDADFTVVGVAETAKIRALGEAPRPYIYAPWEQLYSSNMTVVANTSSPEAALVEMVGALRAMDPEALVYEQKTMARHQAVMLLGHQLSALVVTGFGLIALLLASIGLYGVVSYAVSTRNREVGIRMSLGADPDSVVRLLMTGGMRLVAIGAVLGLGVAFLGAQLISGLLYGVDARNPWVFLGVPLLLGTVALIAAWMPARRAARISPVAALKAE
jgi:predicted permease